MKKNNHFDNYSLKGYFGSQDSLIPFIKRIVQFAKASGKDGISVMGEWIHFSTIEKNDGLLNYETALPTNLKGALYIP